MTRLLAAWVLVASFSANRALAAKPDATPIDGVSFAASFDGVARGWRLRFRPEEGAPREIEAAELSSWGAFVEPTSSDTNASLQIVLASGDLLVARRIELDGSQLRADTAMAGRVKLPLEMVTRIVFHPTLDSAERDRLIHQSVDAKLDQDQVSLDNGDALSGTLVGLAGDRLTLKHGDDTTDVEVARVAVLSFNPALANRAKLTGERAWIGLADGSRLLALGMTADTKQAKLQLSGGVTLSTATSNIVAILPMGGRAEFLSDMKPASHKNIPYLGLPWEYQADRNVLGGALRAGGRLDIKGLGVHSASRMTFDLETPAKRLDAEFAIDASTGRRGSVVFRVFIDKGDGQWSQAFASSVVRGGERPIPMSVDISTAKRVGLVVDYADHGDELDRADWLNARLIR